MTWLEPRTLTALLAAALTTGCVEAGAHRVSREPAAPSWAAADAASSAAQSGVDAGVPPGSRASARGLDVSLSAIPTSICPGECTLLNATLASGRPPYTWRWDHDLPQAPGPHRVCPSATTTYAVTVEDTAVMDLEFPQPEARGSASTTVEVSARCGVADAGHLAQPDAAIDAALPIQAASACTVRIPMQTSKSSIMVGRAGSDVAGNLYLVAMLRGAAQIGPGPLLATDPGMGRLLVAKYDARCEFEWVRWVGEPHPTAGFASVRVSPEGQVALMRNDDFDDPSVPADSQNELVVLTRSGDTAWSLVSPGHLPRSYIQSYGLAWGTDGALAVFGMPALCGQTSGTCVAKVAANGQVLFARSIAGVAGAGVALDAAGNLIAAGISGADGVSIAGLPAPNLAPPFAYVAKFDAKGTPLWLSTTALERYMPIESAAGFVSATSDGALLAVWNSIVPGAATVTYFTRTWWLTPEGAPRSLGALQVVRNNGKSQPLLAATANGELLTAEYYLLDPSKSPTETQCSHELAWYRQDGSVLHNVHVQESVPVFPTGFEVSPAEEPILVKTEAGLRDSAAQTALIVQRFAKP